MPPTTSGSPPPATQGAHNPKRRQYAAGQTQAYYGAAESAMQPGMGQFPPPQMAAGGQFFTPGENQAAGASPAAQAPYYGGQPQQPDYINAPGYTQPVQQQQPVGYPGQQAGAGVDQLAGQFNQMAVGGQKQHLYTTNLLTSPPDQREIMMGPPEINLPPGATLSQSPYANAHPSYQRCTVNAFPSSSSLAGKAKIPLAVVITPYKSIKEHEDPVPLVSDMVIARCRRCRMYINPFVSFIDGGSRWRCPMCALVNEVPQMFDWDQANNQSLDRWHRAELNHGVVEFVAPAEYVVRPPQPLVYVFLIDVSHNAIQSGMVATATRTIMESLERLPNQDGRTRISLIGFDSALYFFSMPVRRPAGAPWPHAHVVAARSGGAAHAGRVRHRRRLPPTAA
jgi:protein transport protein SEC24